MNWVFIGLLLGSMVASQHDSKETCEGRRAILAEKGVNGKCYEVGTTIKFQSYTGHSCLRGDGTSGPC